MKKRAVKKAIAKHLWSSLDSGMPPHLRNKWVRRVVVSRLKELDERARLDDIFGYYVYSRKNNTVRKAKPSEALWENYNCGKRFIKRTDLGDGRFVSTVFLQFDHGFLDNGPPILFETMYFDGDMWDVRQERDTSYKDAIATHDQMVKSVQEEIEALKASAEEITT